MSKSLMLRWVTLPLATVTVAALAVVAQSVGPSPEAARLDGFSQADGANYFALSVRPPAATVADPALPWPPNVAAPATETALVAPSEPPASSSSPALTVVGPV